MVVPRNITLVPLPPYSPELNPVENLWHYLRSHYWSLRVYRDSKALKERRWSLAGGLPGPGVGPLGLRRPLHPPTNLISCRDPYYQVGHGPTTWSTKSVLNKYLLAWSSPAVARISLTILITSSSLR